MKELFESLATVFSSAAKLIEKAAALAAELEPEISETKEALNVLIHHEPEPEDQEIVTSEWRNAAAFLYKYAATWNDVFVCAYGDERFCKEPFMFVDKDEAVSARLADIPNVKYIWLIKDSIGVVLPMLPNINGFLLSELVTLIDKSAINAVCIFLD